MLPDALTLPFHGDIIASYTRNHRERKRANTMTAPGPDAELEPFANPQPAPAPPASPAPPTDTAPDTEPDPDTAPDTTNTHVLCHHTANGGDTDQAGHPWNPTPPGECPSSPHAYVPELPESQRSPRLDLPPIPDGHVAVEIDFAFADSDSETTGIAEVLEQDKGTWAFSCNLELVQLNGPAAGAAVVRLSGLPGHVKGALIRYCGGDIIEAARLYGPGFTDHSATVTAGGR